jgi:hypothetical protein
MRYIKTFNSITEAISLDAAKKATKIFLESGGKERYNEVFKGQDRLYYYMEDDFKKSNSYNPIERDVKQALESSGYEIVDYTKGLASKKGDNKNVFKIQKLLNKIKELDLRNRMDADPSRFSSTKKDKMVVISRHGIDIAGQSTGRDWTSCKSIKIGKAGTDEGVNAKYIWTEIEKGSLVAYLITPEDTNITKPIARIIIGVYVNTKDPKDFILYPDNSIYGNYRNNDFLDFVKKWCIDFNSKISPKNHGHYVLSNECYADSVRNIKINLDAFDDIKNYKGDDKYANAWSETRILNKKQAADQIKYIFKKIEDQEKDLKPEHVFMFLQKLNKDFSPSDYARFINDNSYEEIEKYINKFPNFLVSYIIRVDYNLISDNNKENKIRDSIKNYMEETEGPDYKNTLRNLLDKNLPSLPLNFFRWILE